MATITKGFRFRIYPNKQQRDLLARTFGCTRFVWNQCLSRHKELYEAWEVDPSLPKPAANLNGFNQLLNELKGEYEWLYEVSSVPLQQTTRDLAQAFANFFRNLNQGKVTYPKFKKKSNRNSFRLVGDAFSIRNNEFRIAKIKEPIKVKWSRALPSPPSSCTISQDPSGHYYVSFVCKAFPHLTYGTETTGIDLGLTDFLVTDKGEKVSSPKYLRKSSDKLKHLHRSLSRKVKGSKNRNKARIRLAKQHRKVANQRTDFLHKLSRTLVNENQVIGIESLKVKGMIKKSRLAKSISDAGWSKFKDMLIHKASESGWCTLVHMNPLFPSTQLCSSCGTRSLEKIELQARTWTCGGCGTKHDRDVNAAKNIHLKAVEEYIFAGGTAKPNGIAARLISE